MRNEGEDAVYFLHRREPVFSCGVNTVTAKQLRWPVDELKEYRAQLLEDFNRLDVEVNALAEKRDKIGVLVSLTDDAPLVDIASLGEDERGIIYLRFNGQALTGEFDDRITLPHDDYFRIMCETQLSIRREQQHFIHGRKDGSWKTRNRAAKTKLTIVT